MGFDFNTLSPEELLAAESAVLTMRSLTQAVKTAPQGKGMLCVETALHDKGFEHLRTMLQAAVASHEGAQKKGSVVYPVPAGKKPRSSDARSRSCSAASGLLPSTGGITPAESARPSRFPLRHGRE
jgi:hypothetical protein